MKPRFTFGVLAILAMPAMALQTEPATSTLPEELTVEILPGETADIPAPVLSGALASSDSVITSPSQLPSDASTLYFQTDSGTITITPASAPDWTEGTPLFGSTVKRITYTGSTRPIVYVDGKVDGENQGRWVMEQGIGEGNITKIDGMTAFVVRNLKDTDGSSDVKFGITSASGVSYNHTLAFANMGNAWIINNTRDIGDTTYNAQTGGVVNTKASILFQAVSFVQIGGNKFINHASDHGKFVVGGTIATDGNFTIKQCNSKVSIIQNTVDLSANTSGGDIGVRGGAICAKLGGVEISNNKGDIFIQNNYVVKRGGGDGNTIHGGALAGVGFELLDNAGSMVDISSNVIYITDDDWGDYHGGAISVSRFNDGRIANAQLFEISRNSAKVQIYNRGLLISGC